jgi:K+-transporting ATPase ATPase A chain
MPLAPILSHCVFLATLALLVVPLGSWIHRVMECPEPPMGRWLGRLEGGLYRAAGVDPRHSMPWREYARAFLGFSLWGVVVLFAILMLQARLPGYDRALVTTPMTWDLALNTAVSFVTTTTWQAYAGETTLSHLTQVLGLAAQNFLAGAAGLATGMAFLRSFQRKPVDGLGNFYVDVVRAVLYLLLPLALAGLLLLVGQGVPMTFGGAVHAVTLEGAGQMLVRGPVAALEIIKNLGTAGGGFFNANGAHPYANPTPLTQFAGMLAIVALPAGLTHCFGRITRHPRHGWLLFGVMSAICAAALLVVAGAEQRGNPRLNRLPVAVAASELQPGGNMEGKELRFGIQGTALAVAITANASTGSVNAQPASMTAVASLVALFGLLLGGIGFGGLGTGLCGLVVLALVSLFMGGLMVGRTPEYLGKRIAIPEMKLVAVYLLLGPATILILTAIAVSLPAGLQGIQGDQAAHGFTAILQGYATCHANNGQAFGNLNGNTVFYNLTTVVAMAAGRLGTILPVLALAGRFSRVRARPRSKGTLPTDSLTFALLLMGTALVVGALSFIPALALGPIAGRFGY